MRREAIPSLAICIATAGALLLTLSHERSALIAAVKIVGILGLLALGLSLAFSKKAPQAKRPPKDRSALPKPSA